MAEDVPPCGYKTYAIVKAPEKPLFRTTLRCKGTRLENEYFSIHVDEERGASLRLLDKRTRLVYKGLNLFEDGETAATSTTTCRRYATGCSQPKIRGQGRA